MRKRMSSFWGALLLPALLLMTLFLLARPSPSAAQGDSNFSSVRVENFLRASAKTTRVVTMNGTLNALGTNQPISSTLAVATSGGNITVKPAGTLLILRNVGAQTITFTETATLISAGNLVLGPLDTVSLISDGTNWVQWAASNN